MPISGTIGNLTFFKSSDGFMVKARGSISADKLANSASFERTRENMAEFTRAGEASKVLREAFAGSIKKSKDRRLPSRLTTEMYKVVMSDSTSKRGQRNVTDGEASLLTGFEFNIGANLTSSISAPYTAAINRATGEFSVNVPSFVPASFVMPPQGATHFQLFIGAAAIDFEAGTYEALTAESGGLEYGNTAVTPVSLKITLAANSALPLFLVYGIEFMQTVNGELYPLNNLSFNACTIVKVDTNI